MALDIHLLAVLGMLNGYADLSAEHENFVPLSKFLYRGGVILYDDWKGKEEGRSWVYPLISSITAQSPSVKEYLADTVTELVEAVAVIPGSSANHPPYLRFVFKNGDGESATILAGNGYWWTDQ